MLKEQLNSITFAAIMIYISLKVINNKGEIYSTNKSDDDSWNNVFYFGI